jgi:signal transduction histidine kinase
VIRLTVEDGGVAVEITDDGIGLPGTGASSPPGHRGLTSMRDHAAIAGGWLVVEPGGGGGTQVRFWLPRAQAGRDTSATR